MLVRYVLIVCLLVTYSEATTVVAMLGKEKIVLAADTRQDRLEVFSKKSDHAFHDDGCKVLPLGNAAVGVSGNMDYKRTDPLDDVSDWDALSDAQSAFEANRQDWKATADDWAQRAAAHYRIFLHLCTEACEETG